MGAESLLDLSMAPWKTADQDSGPQQSRLARPVSLCNSKGGVRFENRLFSCSLSKTFSRELNMSGLGNDSNGLPASTAASDSAEEELLKSMEEMEARTIKELLPDDDEFLCGALDGLELFPRPGGGGDAEDELFKSAGGLELEADDNSYAGTSSDPAGAFSGQKEALTGSLPGEHPQGEQPSRTLSVRNVDSSVADSELTALFEPYGDIRSLYTARKNRGLVMISYYDVRSAWNAMRALQSAPLARRKLDIRFSMPEDDPSDQDINQSPVVALEVDSSVSDSDLYEILGAYGDIKEILETPYDRRHMFVEFYDVRAASAALLALNRGDVSGRQPFPRLEQEATGFHQQRSPPRPSLGGRGSQGSASPFMDGSFPPAPFGVLPGFSYPANRSDRCGPMNPGLHSPPTPLPHSLAAGRMMGSGGPEDAGAFGTSGNRSYPLNANQQIWGNLIPRHMICPNPPSPGNLIPSPLPPRGLFGAPLPPNMLRGPPPAVDRSVWLGSPGFPPGGIGSERSAGGCPPHHLELAPHSLLPQQNRHILHASDPSAHRARGRRPDRSPKQGDSRFELDIERVLRGEDPRTTLMIKNIPNNRYTSEMLSDALGEHHRGTYDFLYLPIDFKNKCNVGYAFINMIDPQKIIPLYQTFNGKKWEKFNSEKVASIAYARIQGKAALMAHFRNSSLMYEDIRCRPILFRSDGPHAGDPEPFPAGVNDRPGPSGPSTATREDERERNPSAGTDT